jgi:hypothetical protein
MADLTRERLAELRREANQNTRPSKPVEWSLTVAEAQALVAMASRAVSVETLRKLAEATRADVAWAPMARFQEPKTPAAWGRVQRHVEAVGGRVRLLRGDLQLAEWDEGELVPELQEAS